MQYRLPLTSHEATHKTLLPALWRSELVGLGCASLVGVSLSNYRRARLEYHKTLQHIEHGHDFAYRQAPPDRRGFVR